MARTITHKIENDEISPALFGDKQHLEFAPNQTFTQTIFEALTEREASEQEIKLLDLILNLSFDHGTGSPSATATLEAVEAGKTMGQSVGEGIAQIGDSHGGAGGPLMEALYAINKGQLTVSDFIEKNKLEGKRIPGLGHRVYKDQDPRAELILATASQLGLESNYFLLLKEIKTEFQKQTGRSLPINIDGAIAAAFCALGLQPEAAIAVFIVARSLGLCSHYINQKSG